MGDVGLRALVVATRSPFPPGGGGGLALHGLLQALRAAGVAVRVVALQTPREAARESPYPLRLVDANPGSWVGAVPSLASGTPLAVARYRLPRLAAALDAEIASFAPDVVHLEQLHLAWLLSRLAGRVPVVLRQQNVESLLLARFGGLFPPPLRLFSNLESRRIRRYERWACETATVVAAISEPDAASFRALAPGARVEVLPAAIAFEHVRPQPLRGSPPFLCLGSFDWLPNRDGVRWLVREVWPQLRQLAPHGVLHIAGPGSSTVGPADDPSIERHGRVQTAASLYDPRAVVLIPLRAGSGVRMRLLEAWAAGVPAVASPLAGEGLVTANGDGALLASTAEEFAAAAAHLAEDPDLRQRIVESGRTKVADHDCGRVAIRARHLYVQAIEAHRA
jgi:glycosyltransferase involved in cell wall biosynthesis